MVGDGGGGVVDNDRKVVVVLSTLAGVLEWQGSLFVDCGDIVVDESKRWQYL